MKRKPIHLFWSPFSHRVYATQAYREIKSEGGFLVVEVTGEKFDVTDQIKQLVAEHGPNFDQEPRPVPRNLTVEP